MNFASVPEFSIILRIRLLWAISDIIGTSVMNLCFSPRCLVLYYVGTTVSKSIDFLRGYLFRPYH